MIKLLFRLPVSRVLACFVLLAMSSEAMAFQEVVNFATGSGTNVNGSTLSGINVTTTLGVAPGYNTSGTTSRIDNNNFTFATAGVTSIADTSLTFTGGQVNDNANFPIDFDFAFSGGPVAQVYLHLNSLDQVRLDFDNVANPGVGFQILSSIEANNIGTGGNLSFGDSDTSTFDSSFTQETLDGSGGESADGTIRFFRTDGNLFTSLDLEFVQDPNRVNNQNDRFQFALEISSVPEPSSAVLLALGVLGFTARRRK